MNDVNLNNPNLKLVRSSDQAPVKALSSSQAEGRNASDLASSSAGSTASIRSAQQSSEPSKAERLKARNEDQQENLDEAVTRLNDFVQNVQRDLQFEVDREAGQTIVKVVDRETEEVIRQIPDEVAMRLAENLQQDEPLTLFNIKV
jgi:flagellar protein FlaG